MMLTVPQAAAQLGIPETTLRRLCRRQGRVRGRSVHRRHLAAASRSRGAEAGTGEAEGGYTGDTVIEFAATLNLSMSRMLLAIDTSSPPMDLIAVGVDATTAAPAGRLL